MPNYSQKIFEKLASEKKFSQNKKFRSDGNFNVSLMFTEPALKDIGFMDKDGSWSKEKSGYNSKSEWIKKSTEEEKIKAVGLYLDAALIKTTQKLGGEYELELFNETELTELYYDIFVNGPAAAADRFKKKHNPRKIDKQIIKLSTELSTEQNIPQPPPPLSSLENIDIAALLGEANDVSTNYTNQTSPEEISEDQKQEHLKDLAAFTEEYNKDNPQKSFALQVSAGLSSAPRDIVYGGQFKLQREFLTPDYEHIFNNSSSVWNTDVASDNMKFIASASIRPGAGRNLANEPENKLWQATQYFRPLQFGIESGFSFGEKTKIKILLDGGYLIDFNGQFNARQNLWSGGIFTCACTGVTCSLKDANKKEQIGSLGSANLAGKIWEYPEYAGIFRLGFATPQNGNHALKGSVMIKPARLNLDRPLLDGIAGVPETIGQLSGTISTQLHYVGFDKENNEKSDIYLNAIYRPWAVSRLMIGGAWKSEDKKILFESHVDFASKNAGAGFTVEVPPQNPVLALGNVMASAGISHAIMADGKNEKGEDIKKQVGIFAVSGTYGTGGKTDVNFHIERDVFESGKLSLNFGASNYVQSTLLPPETSQSKLIPYGEVRYTQNISFKAR